MVYQYDNRKEDYLDALALEKANARQNRALLHLILLLVIGCLVYLNMSTLRMSFNREDPVSYGAALVVMAILLVSYSPKIVPSLLFPIKQRLDLLPEYILGPREFEVNSQFLCFRYGGTEVRAGYKGLARINYNEHTVLFYLRNGAVEPVPLRALGTDTSERMAVLNQIQAKVLRDKARQKSDGLPDWMKAPAGTFSCGITEKDVLFCNRFDTRISRKYRLRRFSGWLYFAMILLCCFGGGYGLTHLAMLPAVIRTYLHALYVLEIPAGLIALLYWYRPAVMTDWGIRKSLQLGRYPIGYLESRLVEWDENSLAFRYGVFGLRMDWDCITRISDDGHNLYFYQNDTLLLFLPERPPAFQEFISNRKRIENL